MFITKKLITSQESGCNFRNVCTKILKKSTIKFSAVPQTRKAIYIPMSISYNLWHAPHVFYFYECSFFVVSPDCKFWSKSTLLLVTATSIY